MTSVARVQIDSPLPQLDKLFDYSIPEDLRDQIKVGQRVEVSLGRTKKKNFGFVIELLDTSEYSGKLSSLIGLSSPLVYLTPEIFSLASKISERQASQVSEILKLAIPSHMPIIEKKYLETVSTASTLPELPVWNKQLAATSTATLIESGNKSTLIVEPRNAHTTIDKAEVSVACWIALFADAAIQSLLNGKSSLLVAPDFRDATRLIESLGILGYSEFVVDYSTSTAKSKRYLAFLDCLGENPKIVIGTKSALFAPVANLGSIMIWDESDPLLTDQSAPYLVYRDVALLRQQISNCSLVFASHSRSSDCQRLVEIGFLKDVTLNFPIPRVAVSEPGMRIDSLAFNSLREGLANGPVLVQVSNKGDTSSLFCKVCDEVARCKNCQGPLWMSDGTTLKCRWCNGFAIGFTCACGSSEFNRGRPGSSRTAAELGRSFAGAKVIEATGEKVVRKVSGKNTLVVATAGAEPIAKTGYAAVVILDASTLLARQNLRAAETSVREWSNAIALLAPDGRAVVAGLTGELGKNFSLWSQDAIAQEELVNRKELSFPPVVRLGSVTSEQGLVAKLGTVLQEIGGVTVIGPAPVPRDGLTDQWRLIFKYPHSIGLVVAKTLKSESLIIGSGKFLASKSGRNTRPIRIKMDDTEVI